VSNPPPDEEFALLFAQEAEQRLGHLTRLLVQLEEAGSDQELVASLFRDAHTLKGSAAVVGLDAVGRLAHAMEDVLEELRHGERVATPGLIDALLATVDTLAAIIPSALQGADVSPQTDLAVAALRSAVAPHLEAGPDAVEAAGPATPTVERSEESRHRPEAETIVLPVSRLDELVGLVGESAAAHLRIGRMLAERLGTDPATLSEYRELSRTLNDLQERTMRARMVPVATITDSLHRAVRDLSRSLGKQVQFEVLGGDTELDRGVLQQLVDPMVHLVRNAVDHGVELPAERVAAGKAAEARVKLHAMQLGSEVIITVADDGRGIDVEGVRRQATDRGADVSAMSDEEALYLIFRSGLSTASFISDISGRGVGLDVVRASVDAVRGRIEVRSSLGAGSEFRVIVPITLAVLPCLLVSIGAERYAVPMHSVVVARAAGDTVQTHSEGRPIAWVDGEALAVSSLSGALWGTAAPEQDESQLVVLAGVTRRHAFRVGALVGQRDVVVKGLGRLLPRLDALAGASVEPDGSILLVLDPPGLIDRARLARTTPRAATVSQLAAADDELPRAARHETLLVVDDALTVRELERSILERAGYEVRTAADGIEALALLAERPADLVLTDVEMPRLDGFGLTEAIRAQPTLANVPVLILTSRASEEDRQRGLDAGADGYIVKSAFDESALIGAVQRLLGRRP
jgi:two-component system chemotaxis sensor kinase CheA